MRTPLIVAAVVVVPPIAIFLAVWLSGQTFGQRCEAAFPRNPPEVERCVKRLVRGGDVYLEDSTRRPVLPSDGDML